MIQVISKFLILTLTLTALGINPSVAEDIKDKKILQLESLLQTYIEEIKDLKAKIATLKSSEKIVNENTVEPLKNSTCGTDYNQCAPKELCAEATYKLDGQVQWKRGLRKAWVTEAKKRNLSCGIIDAKETSLVCEQNPSKCNKKQLCDFATTRLTGAQRAWKSGTFQKFVDEAKRRNLKCRVTYAEQSISKDKENKDTEKKALLAAETEAKRKAEEEKRLAAEAQAKRKAKEEARLAAEAEARRKAEKEARLAAEAEAKRKAEEEERLAAEEEKKRKEEEKL